MANYLIYANGTNLVYWYLEDKIWKSIHLPTKNSLDGARQA